jgi:hypothetical protein
MQFTVLIEFLVPGLAMTLLILFLLPVGSVPQLPQGLPAGETASALLLLAVSYPVGILTNFPVFQLIQRRIVSFKARQYIVEKYAAMGIDLEALVNMQFGITLPNSPAGNREGLRALFSFMRAFVFTKNIERLNANHLYHEGLQRLARGMLLPLLLASIVIYSYKTPLWPLLILLCALLAISSCALLLHSVKTEDEQIVRFFVVLTSITQGTVVQSSTTADDMPNVRA